jgi:cytochrome b6-f complex iron-sulfur subunit
VSSKTADPAAGTGGVAGDSALVDADVGAVSRRRFLRFGIFGAIVSAAGGVVAVAAVSFANQPRLGVLVSPLSRRLGKRLQPVLHVQGSIFQDFFLAEFPADALQSALPVYPGQVHAGMEAGVIALSRRCPHLGNQVVFCEGSQRFECPSHGAEFSAVGEHTGGPAYGGMDLFRVTPRPDGRFEVFTDQRIPGTPTGTDTTGQAEEGPSCVWGM